MKIYTRRGDRGQTSLFGGAAVRKDDPRIEAYGTVDELNSAIGLTRAFGASSVSPIDSDLEEIQRTLFEVGAHLASPGAERFPPPSPEQVERLERRIDELESTLQPLATFILPGGVLAAAQLHVARTVCRRAERLIVPLFGDAGDDGTIVYMNRLSDFLFVAARAINRGEGAPDVPWQGSARGR
jgi:cob(I)alamin adenosyltransferase